MLGTGCVFELTGAWTSSLVQANTPFNQWMVYRQIRLLIDCHKKDSATYPLAQELVATLQEILPEAKALDARIQCGAPASLPGTEKFDFALLGYSNAKLMSAGEGSFKSYVKIELNALFLLPKYVLVGRSDIPGKHAWLIAHALSGSMTEGITLKAQTPPLPWHADT